MFAQQREPFSQQSDSSPAVLAMLDVEPDDKDAPRETSHDSGQEPGLQPSAGEATAAAKEPATAAVTDTLAAVSTADQPASVNEAAGTVATAPEAGKMTPVEPEVALGEGSSAVESAALSAATNLLDTKIASAAEPESKTVEPSAGAEPINVPAVAPEPIAPAPQIAALGGSPEATHAEAREKGMNNTGAAPRRDLSRLRALRAAKARRRLAHRAQVLRRAALQQQQQHLPTGFTSVPATPNVTTTENPYRF